MVKRCSIERSIHSYARCSSTAEIFLPHPIETGLIAESMERQRVVLLTRRRLGEIVLKASRLNAPVCAEHISRRLSHGRWISR